MILLYLQLAVATTILCLSLHIHIRSIDIEQIEIIFAVLKYFNALFLYIFISTTNDFFSGGQTPPKNIFENLEITVLLFAPSE